MSRTINDTTPPDLKLLLKGRNQRSAISIRQNDENWASKDGPNRILGGSVHGTVGFEVEEARRHRDGRIGKSHRVIWGLFSSGRKNKKKARSGSSMQGV